MVELEELDESDIDLELNLEESEASITGDEIVCG